MTLLVDHQIANRQTSPKPLATNVPADDCQKSDSKIQAASIDLTIGDIYIPGTDKDKPGGADTPLNNIVLNQGHTAVIRTKEELDLGSNLAGIAFPPAGVSLKGLLTTNPGHIDPGYQGPLHLTVINMSHEPFSLRQGDRIMRVLFIPLENPPEVPFDVRRPGPLNTPITSELLSRLSVDFVDVEKRAQKIAKGAVRRAQLWAIRIPVVVAILALIGNYWMVHPSLKGDVKKLTDRVDVNEKKLSQQVLDKRMKNLEDTVKNLQRATTSK